MTEKDLEPGQSITPTLDGAQVEVAPYLAWLPDWLEPYAVYAVAVIVIIGFLFALWRTGVDIWRLVIWAPKIIWRRVTGYQPPKSVSEQTLDSAKDAAEIAKRAELKIDDLHTLFAAQAKEPQDSRSTLPEEIIERAVAAAEEVLSSNDPAKAKAQEALRQGDVPTAEKALEEAFDREAEAATRLDDQAAQLKFKAARTAREIAALTAVRSVAEARRWYVKAAEFEPDDFWTHIELARLHQAGGDIIAALEAAQYALRVAGNDRERSVALNDIGDGLVSQGALDRGLESFQASMDITKRLAEADASNANLQRDLSVSHEKIGDVLVSQGALDRALESFQASMDIAKRLAEADASNANLQRDLSVSHNKIGDVWVSQGALDRALESFQASMDIRKRLAEADASNANLQRDLSVSHERIGDTHEHDGKISDAIASYEQSLIIVRSLARRFPKHQRFQSDLIITERRLNELRVKLK